MYNHMVSFAYLQQQKTVHHHRVRPSCAGALAQRVLEVQVPHVCSLWNQADKRLQQWWWSLIWFQEIQDGPSKASLLRKWLRLKSLWIIITTPCLQQQESVNVKKHEEKISGQQYKNNIRATYTPPLRNTVPAFTNVSKWQQPQCDADLEQQVPQSGHCQRLAVKHHTRTITSSGLGSVVSAATAWGTSSDEGEDPPLMKSGECGDEWDLSLSPGPCVTPPRTRSELPGGVGHVILDAVLGVSRQVQRIQSHNWMRRTQALPSSLMFFVAV